MTILPFLISSHCTYLMRCGLHVWTTKWASRNSGLFLKGSLKWPTYSIVFVPPWKDHTDYKKFRNHKRKKKKKKLKICYEDEEFDSEHRCYDPNNGIGGSLQLLLMHLEGAESFSDRARLRKNVAIESVVAGKWWQVKVREHSSDCRNWTCQWVERDVESGKSTAIAEIWMNCSGEIVVQSLW